MKMDRMPVYINSSGSKKACQWSWIRDRDIFRNFQVI